MHPALTLAIASAREQDIRRHAREQRRVRGLGGRHAPTTWGERFSRYSAYAGTSDQQSLRRPGRRARGA